MPLPAYLAQDEDSIALVLHAAWQLTQYGEDREPREGNYQDR